MADKSPIMSDVEKILAALLEPLLQQWGITRQAYLDYMASERRFRHAFILRHGNSEARNLLVHHGHLLPQDLRPAAQELIEHYNVWISEWDALYDELAPNEDDVFVFVHTARFPRDAEARITQYTHGLREQCALEI
jgi:hypothetical protein